MEEEEVKRGKGGQSYGDKGDLILVGEQTMWYTDGVLLNCIHKAYIILLSNVTSTNLIKKRKNAKSSM